MIPYEIMGHGRAWATGLLAVDTYLSVQFWTALFVLAACLPQLHIGRKFRWPPEPGRLTVLGGYLGLTLQSARLTLLLADLGACLDFVATIIGRLGITLQAVTAVFALDDAIARPAESRPLLTWALTAIVMVQIRALTAYSSRDQSARP